MPLPLSPEAQDRARGALLGLAVGDALGTTLEFTERDRKPHHTEMTGGGPFGLEPGQWTDDTSMALALADSLVERRGFDPRDLMTRFVAWRKKGDYSCTGTCFDIGITTQRALTTFQRTGEPFAGSTALDDAGNGSIMRLAPAVLFTLQADDDRDASAGSGTGPGDARYRRMSGGLRAVRRHPARRHLRATGPASSA